MNQLFTPEDFENFPDPTQNATYYSQIAMERMKVGYCQMNDPKKPFVVTPEKTRESNMKLAYFATEIAKEVVDCAHIVKQDYGYGHVEENHARELGYTYCPMCSASV